jgi:hypothetical protein
MTQLLPVSRPSARKHVTKELVGFYFVNLSALCGSSSFAHSTKPLENARRAHAAADAHGYHAVASVAALEFANDAGR